MANEHAMNIKQLVPLLMVRDMQSSLSFYVKGIGCEITNKWIYNDRVRWCWLQIDGAALMLQEYVSDEHHQSIPAEHSGAGVSFYFTCDDALAFYHAVIAKGLSPSEPFVGNKMWVVGLSDPDGYQIFFESATDVTEETSYSDWNKSNTA